MNIHHARNAKIISKSSWAVNNDCCEKQLLCMCVHVFGWAYRGLTGGFLLLQNFSVAISVNPHVCFILVLILISMFLR